MLLSTLVTSLLGCAFLLSPAGEGCGPGRGYGKRRSTRKLLPLAYKQFSPNVAEKTLGASGRYEGKITRNSERFKELTPNYNPDIIFKDEENTALQRQAELFGHLGDEPVARGPAPGHRGLGRGRPPLGGVAALRGAGGGHHHVRPRPQQIRHAGAPGGGGGLRLGLLRVQGAHPLQRQVRSGSASPVLDLIRRATNQDDHSVAAKSGGCFPGEASVALEGGGTKAVRDLQPGERVLALADAGELVYSQVLAFLDRDPGAWKLFYTLHTRAGPRLALTAAHLLFVAEGNCSEGAEPAPGALKTVYASRARAGQCVLVSRGRGPARLSRITRVTLRGARGAFAPLTQQGTLVVDGVAASCYAVVEQHHLAHWAFSPLRLLHRWTGAAGGHGDGLHWYPQLLHRLGGALLDPGRFHPLGVARDAR